MDGDLHSRKSAQPVKPLAQPPPQQEVQAVGLPYRLFSVLPQLSEFFRLSNFCIVSLEISNLPMSEKVLRLIPTLLQAFRVPPIIFI